MLTACGGGGSSNSGISDDSNNTAPVLTIINGEQLLAALNSVYIDEGASAADAEDGDISAQVVTEGTVDTSKAGSYTITYNVVDSGGLAASPAVRTVLVVEPLTFTVDPTLGLDIEELKDPDGGAARPVGAISTHGKKAHLVENEIMIATDDSDVVDAFIARWNGRLLESIALEGTADMHTIYVDPTDVALDDLEKHIGDISEINFGDIQFSSENTQKLYAIVAAELALRDLTVSLNWVMLNQSVRTGTTAEQASSSDDDYTEDAFLWPYMNQGSAQDTGAASAWQTLDLMGITGAQRIMVIDSGFMDIGDYPSASVPAGAGWGQRSTAGCSSVSCYWHGTEVAHVALGDPDNGLGIAGSAGPYGHLEPVQFSGISFRGVARIFGLLLTAPLNGAPAVVNISGSADIPPPVNVGLNRLLDPLFNRALDFGVLVVAAAGNDGEDVDDSFRIFWVDVESSTVVPCETSSVICVGGLQWDSNRRHGGSNYGSHAEADSVDIYAPYEVWAPAIDADGVNLNSVKKSRGTSFSAPFVSGVIAMMKAANPDLSAAARANCLLRSAHQGDGVLVHSRGGNQRRVDAFEAVICALGSRARFPLLSIDSPANGTTVAGATDLILNAASMGHEGIPLSIRWSSDRDGAIGSVWQPGVDVRWNGLSVGSHVLTAEVTDSDGETLSDTVSVTITNNPPTARILAPRDGDRFGVGQSISLRALAEDVDAGPTGELEGSQISWSITGNGFTATGKNAIIPAGQLPIGEYTLRLVADDGTDSAEDSVSFSVTECTGSCPTVAILSPGDTVIRTATLDDEGRAYAEVDFEGFATDEEDGEFAGRVDNGPMLWSAVNALGRVSQICTPLRLEPPLVPVTREQACKTFSSRLYLGASNADENYIITLEVTDSDGNRAATSVSVTLVYDLI